MNAASQATRSSRAAHSQAQRERILSAAQQCFTEHGFHAASMAQIAKTADISAGLIYRYFKSKSELIHGIVERQMQCLAGDMRAMESVGTSPVEQIMRVLKDEAACNTPGRPHLEPSLVLEITAESRRDPMIAEVLQRFSQQIDQAVAERVAQPQNQGGFGVPANKVAQRSLALRALVDGLRQRQASNPDMDLEEVQAMLQDVLPLLMSE